MTRQEKMRQEFEAWFKYNYSWFIEKGMDGYSLARFEDNPHQYVDTITHHDWRVWKASRESLVIELPQPFEGDDFTMYDGKEIIESIHAAGVKTK